MGYKVVRIKEETDVLAEDLHWEDAIAIVVKRAASQRLSNYRYEVRTEDNSMIYKKRAHWDGS